MLAHSACALRSRLAVACVRHSVSRQNMRQARAAAAVCAQGLTAPPPPRVATGACCREDHGCDQGIHNFLCHWWGPKGLLTFNYRTVKNWDSPVHTGGG